MKTIGKLALAASAILWMSAAMVRRTIRQRRRRIPSITILHPGGAYVGVPGVVGVHVGPGGPGTGCETRSRTVRDEDTGDSHTHTETNC